MADVLNPVDVERAIRDAVNIVAEGVKVVSQRLDVFRSAERVYDLAFARAFMAHEGPQTEKRYAAEIGSAEQRRDRDAAEVAFKYASARAKAAELELSAWQTLSRSVNQMYSAASQTGEY